MLKNIFRHLFLSFVFTFIFLGLAFARMSLDEMLKNVEKLLNDMKYQTELVDRAIKEHKVGNEDLFDSYIMQFTDIQKNNIGIIMSISEDRNYYSNQSLSDIEKAKLEELNSVIEQYEKLRLENLEKMRTIRKELEESRAEVRENIIDLNESNAITFIKLILQQRVIYRLSHNLYPSNFSEFMDGLNMGGDIGKIHINDYGNIELLGYKFIYYSNEGFFKLSAEPILPGISGERWFVVGQKSDGTAYVVEDLNKNGKLDLNEAQLN